MLIVNIWHRLKTDEQRHHYYCLIMLKKRTLPMKSFSFIILFSKGIDSYDAEILSFPSLSLSLHHLLLFCSNRTPFESQLIERKELILFVHHTLSVRFLSFFFSSLWFCFFGLSSLKQQMNKTDMHKRNDDDDDDNDVIIEKGTAFSLGRRGENVRREE